MVGCYSLNVHLSGLGFFPGTRLAVKPHDHCTDMAPRERRKAGTQERRSNRIQVSLRSKSVFFYSNLAKKFLQNEEEVELSALGFGMVTNMEQY